MQFINKGSGSDTSDATATENDVLFPKIAYGKNGKFIGNIEVNYKEIPNDLTATKLNFEKLLMDINDKANLAVYVEDTIVYICKWNNDNLGEVLDSIDIGSPVKECKIANHLINGKLYIYCSDTTTCYLYALTFDINTGKFDTKVNSFNLALSSSSISMAVNPVDSRIIAITYVFSWSSHAVLVSYDGTNFAKIVDREFSGNTYSPKQMTASWNEDGSYLICQDSANKRRCIYIYANNTITAIRLDNTTCLTAIYKHFYFYNNQLKVIADGNVVKQYDDVVVSTKGYMWVYNDIWYVLNFETHTLIVNKIGDDLELIPMFTETIPEVSSLYNLFSTISCPTKNYLMLDLDNFYKFISESVDIRYEDVNIYGNTFVDTTEGNIEEQDVLENKIAYSQNKKIIGTMPDNAELEFKPSEEEQTIPLGYTSGGKILPINIEELNEYKSCLRLSELIRYNTLSLPKNNLLYVFNDIGYTFNENSWDTLVSQSLFSSEYTIIARIYPTAYNNYRGLFGLHGEGGLVGLQYDSGRITMGHASTTSAATFATSLLPLNTWSIFVAKYDGTNAEFFINKESVLSKPFEDIKPLGNLVIGKAFNGSNRYYKGKLSDFIVYNKALSEDELSQVYKHIDNLSKFTTGIYNEVEYVEGTGTQYIDTGIIPSNHKIEIKFQFTKNENNKAIFGTKEGILHLTWYSNTWYYECGKNTAGHCTPAPTQCTDLQTVVFNNDNNTIEINGEEYGTTATSVDNQGQTLYLWRRPVGTAGIPSARIYYCKIWDKDTGELVRDFVPVKNVTNNEVGLYDLVEKVFYKNSGTGKFIEGSVE